MTIKTILASLRGDAMDTNCLAVAGSLAHRCHAHIVALHTESDPMDVLASAMYDVGGTTFTEDLVKTLQAQNDARRDVVKRHFSEWRTSAGIPEATKPGETPNQSVELILKVDSGSKTMRDRALAADLVVLGLASGKDDDNNLNLEVALIDAGRPVIALPADGLPSSADAPIAIAWNGSAESARALSASFPLIRDASRVVLLHAGREPGGLDEIVSYLAWHDIAATAEELGGKDDPEVLIARKVVDLGASMLVMGAYTHSRAREFVFGGVTRRMLQEARVPLFLAH
jgi:nucleotide-binding universal stress UspA family protein